IDCAEINALGDSDQAVSRLFGRQLGMCMAGTWKPASSAPSHVLVPAPEPCDLSEPAHASMIAAARRLDRSDVYFLHGHHRIERALCFIAADRHRLGQHTRRDLPRNAPLV